MPKQNKNINKVNSVPPNLNEGFLSVADIAKFSPYSSSYISLRIRQGKLKGEKIGRNWFTKKEWLDEYIEKHGEKVQSTKFKVQNEEGKVSNFKLQASSSKERINAGEVRSTSYKVQGEEENSNVKIVTGESAAKRMPPKSSVPTATNQSTPLMRPKRRNFDILKLKRKTKNTGTGVLGLALALTVLFVFIAPPKVWAHWGTQAINKVEQATEKTISYITNDLPSFIRKEAVAVLPNFNKLANLSTEEEDTRYKIQDTKEEESGEGEEILSPEVRIAKEEESGDSGEVLGEDVQAVEEDVKSEEFEEKKEEAKKTILSRLDKVKNFSISTPKAITKLKDALVGKVVGLDRRTDKAMEAVRVAAENSRSRVKVKPLSIHPDISILKDGVRQKGIVAGAAVERKFSKIFDLFTRSNPKTKVAQVIEPVEFNSQDSSDEFLQQSPDKIREALDNSFDPIRQIISFLNPNSAQSIVARLSGRSSELSGTRVAVNPLQKITKSITDLSSKLDLAKVLQPAGTYIANVTITDDSNLTDSEDTDTSTDAIPGVSDSDGNLISGVIDMQPAVTLVEAVNSASNQESPEPTVSSTLARCSKNEWHHVVVLNDGSENYLFYVDGIGYAATTNTMTGTYNNLDQSSIGRLWRGASSYGSSQFDGSISDVRIYNRALTAEEIGDLYGQYNPVVKTSSLTKGLVGSWSLSDTDEVVGAEMVTNGTFDSDVASWTEYQNGLIAWNAGKGDLSALTTNPDMVRQTVGLTDGQSYRLSYVISNLNGGSAVIQTNYSNSKIGGGDHAVTISADGQFSSLVEGSASAEVLDLGRVLSNGTERTLTYDNVSVKPLLAGDLTPNENNGTVHGGAYTTDRNGQSNKAMDFDGTADYINIDGIISEIASDTEGTWSAWVKPDEGFAVDSSEMFISVGDTNADEFMDFYYRTDGKLEAFSRDGGVNQWDLKTDNPIFTNESQSKYTHVALVQNGTAPVFYVNGELAASTLTITTDTTDWMATLTGLDNVRIGTLNKNSAGETNHFDGSMLDARIYNRALTAEEVGMLYKSY